MSTSVVDNNNYKNDDVPDSLRHHFNNTDLGSTCLKQSQLNEKKDLKAENWTIKDECKRIEQHTDNHHTNAVIQDLQKNTREIEQRNVRFKFFK
jgi:hypothetical protein